MTTSLSVSCVPVPVCAGLIEEVADGSLMPNTVQFCFSFVWCSRAVPSTTTLYVLALQ